MSTYKIEKQFFANVTPHQREAMLAAFEVDDNGDIIIPYEHADFLETEKGKECISEFDQVLPDYKGISKIKKIDSILWSIR